MTIVNDRANQRVVDTKTGEYMTWATENREEATLYFILHDRDGKGLLGTIVKEMAIGEPGSGGAATLLKFVLQNTWIPTGKPERPTYFHGPHNRIAQLKEFLYVWRHYGGIKTPDLRIEFVDAREKQGDRK